MEATGVLHENAKRVQFYPTDIILTNWLLIRSKKFRSQEVKVKSSLKRYPKPSEGTLHEDTWGS
jgi:hypothetical protein